jgi:hypothetical protein
MASRTSRKTATPLAGSFIGALRSPAPVSFSISAKPTGVADGSQPSPSMIEGTGAHRAPGRRPERSNRSLPVPLSSSPSVCSCLSACHHYARRTMPRPERFTSRLQSSDVRMDNSSGAFSSPPPVREEATPRCCPVCGPLKMKCFFRKSALRRNMKG